MTPETLAALRRKLSSARSAVKAAQARLDRADRFRAQNDRAQNEAATRLHDAQYRADDLQRRVNAAARALALKETP